MLIRYGKRTTQGILNDLWNALARYYLNNIADGTKQGFFCELTKQVF
jgi:phosphatidylinositol 4-phosphatase